MSKRSLVRLLVLTVVLVIPVLLLSVSLFQPTGIARGKSAAIPLSSTMTPEQAQAQELALDDYRVQAYTAGHRSEVFGVRQILADQYTAASAACASADCRQVEIYNYDENAAVTAIVNLDTSEVLDVLYLVGMHPGINKRLADRAMDIALNAPEVIDALGYRPTSGTMSPVPGDLVDSSCAGDHLCAAPSFELGDRTLWAVVDLTDDRLAGINWTPSVPNTPGAAVPFVPEGCPVPGSVNRDGWAMDYETTGTDGLRVYNVTYNGTEVLTSVKNVEWHADYGSSGYRDSTGCGGGGGGFPIYPYGETQINDLYDGLTIIGFEVVQDFRMSSWGNSCNYRYEQHIQFFTDGRFRVVSGAYGKGCGTNSMYRPVTRIDIAVDGDQNDNFDLYDGSAWVPVTTETYRVPYTEVGHGPHHLTAENYSWRVYDDNGMGYNIEQDIGQFPLSRGASPFVYPTLHHPEEGDTDLGVIGACCNDNHVQGPDQFVNGENIESANIVMWYVSQMLTDVTPGNYYCWTITGEPNPETYPCFTGPMFHPFGTEGVAAVAGFTHDAPKFVGEPVQFTNTSTGTLPIDYSWDFGDGSRVEDGNDPSHVYVDHGDYVVTLTASNNWGSSTFTDTVTIYMTATAGTIEASNNGQPVQVGEVVNFSSTANGTGPLTYAWDFGDGATSSDPSPSHAFTAPGTYTVMLTVTNQFGSDTAEIEITVEATATDYYIYLPVMTRP
jgi:PKD repeat protein